MTDTLPAELGFVSATGTGWTCGALGQVVTCTRTASIGAGATAPAITLTVAVDPDATAEETTNTASVSTADDVNPANDSDSDLTALTAADLALEQEPLERLPGRHDPRLRAARVQRRLAARDGHHDGHRHAARRPDLRRRNRLGLDLRRRRPGRDLHPHRRGRRGANAPAITLQVAVGNAAYPVA